MIPQYHNLYWKSVIVMKITCDFNDVFTFVEANITILNVHNLKEDEVKHINTNRLGNLIKIMM